MDEKARLERVKREKKIKAYREERTALDDELRTLNHRRSKIGKRKKAIANAIYDLLHENGEVPSVTDHAIVRYLERIQGVDIQQLKIDVANHKQAERQGNVIVTVNEDLASPKQRKES